MKSGDQGDWIVIDQVEPCAYLPGRMARLPLRWAAPRLTGEQLDRRLAEGQRRCGSLLYDTRCPACRACEALRVDVERFTPNRSQRRAARRGRNQLEVRIGPPQTDAQRVRLYNRHKELRGLDADRPPIDAAGYAAFLVQSCCETFELAYYHRQRLIAVAIADRGACSLSAVYCCFDPDYERLQPGVVSILTQIDLCRQWNLRWLYLGYYIAALPSMAYKANYLPHERLIDGQWRRFERSRRP